MFRRLTIIGFVGQDPSMRYGADGTPVTNFSVATRQVVSKDRVPDCPAGWKESLNGHLRPGADHPSTGLTCACGKVQAGQAWFRVTVWRRLADACNQYLAKGYQVLVEGQLHGDAEDGSQDPRSW